MYEKGIKKEKFDSYFKICGLTNVSTSCTNFSKLPNRNVGPNVLNRAGIIEACFFLVLFENSMCPPSDLNEARACC